jgi:hypothetical protein
MFSVRFGPHILEESRTPLGSLVAHLFQAKLVGCDPATFYVPLVDTSSWRDSPTGWANRQDNTAAKWTIKPLVA